MRSLAVWQAGERSCALLACGLLLALSAPARSEETAGSSPYEQVIIFQSGRTLKGKLSRSPNGYELEQPTGGRLVVPFDEVRVVGSNLPDAFKRLRESFVELTAETHYQLGLWCFEHHLAQEAREELATALDRDPDHEGARDLLKRMDALEAAARKPAATPQPKSRIAFGREIRDVEALGGLSPETAQLFTLRVMPVLNNKCGRAGCHGSQSDREFRLEAVRGTGARHPLHAERNLASVLAQVNVQTPDQSPLLSACDGQHGGSSRAIFLGPQGAKQRKILRDWIRMAAKETEAQQVVSEQRPTVVAKPKPNRSHSKISSSRRSAEDLEEPEPATMASVSDEAADNEDDENSDPFSPEAFNERHHGIVTKKETRKPVRKSPALPKDSPR